MNKQDELYVEQGGGKVYGTDIVILSWENDRHYYERYYGARTKKALRSKLLRIRDEVDGRVTAWIADGTKAVSKAGSLWPVYYEISEKCQAMSVSRVINPAAIYDNPAAMLRAGKKNSASAENGKLGGRPKSKKNESER